MDFFQLPTLPSINDVSLNAVPTFAWQFHIFWHNFTCKLESRFITDLSLHLFFLGMTFGGEIDFHGGISPFQFHPFRDYVPLPCALH